MEQVKKFFALMLPALAAVAAYDLIIKPLINKAKTSLPMSGTGSASDTN
jgi:hypothetical protein